MTRLLPLCGALIALAGCTATGGIAEALDPTLPETVSFAPGARDTAAAIVGGEADDTAEIAAYAPASPAIEPPTELFAPQGGVAARSPELDALIARYAVHYEVPEELVRRVVKRESNFRPQARNGPYWGLMQILPQTARTMGHRGPTSELLDAETNLRYAVKYLRGAYLTARGNHDLAVRFYARGYYYDAKRAGLLDETGLGRDRRRARRG